MSNAPSTTTTALDDDGKTMMMTTTTTPSMGPTSQPVHLTLTEPPSATTRDDSTIFSSKTVIGYFPSWQWYDRQRLAEPRNFDFSKVTRV